jgi:hypothetical protein
MANFKIKKTLKLVKSFSNTYKFLRNQYPYGSVFYCSGCNIYIVYVRLGDANFKIWSESSKIDYDLDDFDYDIEPRIAMSGVDYVRI